MRCQRCDQGDTSAPFKPFSANLASASSVLKPVTMQVKAVMVDSANDSVTSLKTSLRAAEAERADCRKRVSKLQHALMNREEDEAHRLEAMQYVSTMLLYA